MDRDWMDDISLEKPKTIKKTGEYTWVIGFSMAVMSILILPYIVAYSHQGNQWVFTGFLFGVEDGNSYIAKMLSGAAGNWLFRTPYTSFPQAGILAFIPYLLMGKLTAPPGQHTQLIVIFQLFVFIAGILDILATYYFISVFIREIKYRRLGTIIAILGGGLGWVLISIGQSHWLGSLPLDFYSPETFGFLEIFGLPHLAMARACLLMDLALYIQIPVQGDHLKSPLKMGLAAGLFLLLTGIFQPLTALIGWFVIALHVALAGFYSYYLKARQEPHQWIVWKSYLQKSACIGLISCPVIIYTGIISITDPFMKSWTAQNLILSPNFLHYLIAYGLVIPFAVLGGTRLFKADVWKGIFLGGWAISLPILAYAPYNLQRRLPEGTWVALITLALVFFGSSRFISGRKLAGFSLLLFPTTLLFYFGSLGTVSQAKTPLFRPTDEVAAFQYLAAKTKPGMVVIAAYQTSNGLPAWAPDKVIVGHGPESIDFKTLSDQIISFYDSNKPDSQRLALIDEFHAQFVFWGPEEKTLGDWSPTGSPFLRQVYHQGEYQIYQVEPNH